MPPQLQKFLSICKKNLRFHPSATFRTRRLKNRTGYSIPRKNYSNISIRSCQCSFFLEKMLQKALFVHQLKRNLGENILQVFKRACNEIESLFADREVGITYGIIYKLAIAAVLSSQLNTLILWEWYSRNLFYGKGFTFIYLAILYRLWRSAHYSRISALEIKL